MYDPEMNAPPLNPLPLVVIVLTCAIGGIEAIFQAAEAGFIGGQNGIGWRLAAMQRFGFSDPLLEWMWNSGNFAPENLLRFVSYTFVHQSLVQAIFAMVFVLAMGKFVAEIVNQFAVLVIFFASAAIGALIYSLLLDEPYAMLGAYPAVYGLIGAFTWLRFSSLQDQGESGLQAFNLIVFFMSISLIFKFLFGGTNVWLAELAGFFVGFSFAIVLGPNAKNRMQKFLTILRQR